MRLPIPAFFDDVVRVVTVATLVELIPKCTHAMEKPRKCVASRGMEVNDNVGKTEVFLQFNGTGVAIVRDASTQGPRTLIRNTHFLDASTLGSDRSTIQTFGFSECGPTQI